MTTNLKFHAKHSAAYTQYSPRPSVFGLDCTVCHRTILVDSNTPLVGFVCCDCRVKVMAEPIANFFAALAQYCAATKSGVRQLKELDELSVSHRVVKVLMQQEHMTCMARVDMPEFGVVAGQTFDLYLSGYADIAGNTYAYIVATSGCSCVGYEHRHQCRHSQDASKRAANRYYANVALKALKREAFEKVRQQVREIEQRGKAECRAVTPLRGRGFRVEYCESLGHDVPMAS